MVNTEDRDGKERDGDIMDEGGDRRPAVRRAERKESSGYGGYDDYDPFDPQKCFCAHCGKPDCYGWCEC